jgi:type I restriction enzyme, S subunit
MSKKKKKSVEELLEEALVPEEEQPYKVPENWVWIRLGKVTSINPTKPKLLYQDDLKCSFLPMSKVDPESGRIIQLEERPFFKVKKGYTYFQESDVLFAKITPCMENGNSVIAKGLLNGFGFGSTEFYVFRSTKAVDHRYIYHLVRSSRFRNQAKQVMTGAVGQQRVPKSFLEAYKLPLPPVNEQKRIVDRLERLLNKIDEAKQLIEEAKETFELRRAAILNKAFHGELTTKWRDKNPNESADEWLGEIKQDKQKQPEEILQIDPPFQVPKGWKWVKLSELGTLERGRSKHRPRNDKRLFGGSYPFIQTGDIARANDKITSHSQTLSEFGFKQSKLFPEDTVCITIAANIADTAILAYPCCFPDSVVGFISYNGSVSAEYVHYYLTTIKNEIEQYAPATAQKNINLKILSNIIIPIPPKREHDEIITIVRRLIENEKKASLIFNLNEKLDEIRQSILSKAFRGELGTNDPTEESAIELLKEALLCD